VSGYDYWDGAVGEFVAILSTLKVFWFFARFRVHFRRALKYILIYVDL